MAQLDTSISRRRNQRKIRAIAKNQLSHRADLPRRQAGSKTKRVDIRELPFSAIANKRISAGLPLGVTPSTYLPPAERTYVEGRTFTISA